MAFSEAVRLLRMESGFSQRQLAEKFEVDRATIARWEAGVNYPKKRVTDRILAVITCMDVSAQCKEAIKDSLTNGTRQGTSAREFGISDIDQELICKIVDESANAVYAIEADTYKILYANKNTEQISDFDSKSIKDKKCYEYMMNRKSPCRECPLSGIRGYEFSEQTIFHKAHGDYLRVRGRKMKWNGKNIYITYVTNITEIVKEEKAKQQFLDLMPVGAGVYRVYFDGRLELIYMNEGFYRMLGIKRESIELKPGFTQLKLVHPDDAAQIRSLMKKVLIDPQGTIGEEYRIDVGDGDYRRVMIRGLVTGKTPEYYTFNCSFISLNEEEYRRKTMSIGGNYE